MANTKVTLIWANDGWCYIPQLSIRRKVTEAQYIKEVWDGVIAMPEYIEEVIWQEDELAFQRRTSTPDTRKKTTRQRAPRQPPQRA